MGETVRLTPSSLRSDADSILSIRITIELAGSSLESGLSGTAGMLGSDPTAEDAGPALQSAIDSTLDSLRSTVDVVGSFAVMTQATARAYRQTELAGAYQPTGGCEIPELTLPASRSFSVPNVEGADSPPFVGSS